MSFRKCGTCGWTYPDNLLNPLITSNGSAGLMCGICALEATNKIHGSKRRRFDGEIAENMRVLAIRWRKHNPTKGPV